MEGFEGENAYFYCGQNGQWQGAITCIPILCPGMIPNNNSDEEENFLTNSSCKNPIFGSVCKASCTSGSHGESKDYKCGSDGQWKAVTAEITCKSIYIFFPKF